MVFSFEGEITVCEKEIEEGCGKYLKIKKIDQKYLENELHP
jgi:hypothetical protein